MIVVVVVVLAQYWPNLMGNMNSFLTQQDESFLLLDSETAFHVLENVSLWHLSQPVTFYQIQHITVQQPDQNIQCVRNSHLVRQTDCFIPAYDKLAPCPTASLQEAWRRIKSKSKKKKVEVEDVNNIQQFLLDCNTYLLCDARSISFMSQISYNGIEWKALL